MPAYTKGDKVLNGWTVVRRIGRGATGTVYEVEKAGYGVISRSALKVVSIPPSESDIVSMRFKGMDDVTVAALCSDMASELLREVATLSSLSHPNVVVYQDHEVDPHEDGLGMDVLLRMELLEPLEARVGEEPFAVDEVLSLGVQVAGALAYCHERGVVHRDVKPQNVFVGGDGRYKLGDFGVSRVVEGSTDVMSFKGTPPYMAPELVRGASAGPSVDVYSLGIMLYELLNRNRRPWLPFYPEPVTYESFKLEERKKMSGEPVPLIPGCDEGLFGVVARACAYDPDERPTASELRDELRAFATASFNGAEPPVPDSLSDGGTKWAWETFGELSPDAVREALRDDQSGREAGARMQREADSLDRDLNRTIVYVSDQHYTGHTLEPKPDVYLDGVKLELGRDYDVVYRDNVGVPDSKSMGVVIISGTGKYKGRKVVYFCIEPDDSLLRDISAASISVPAQRYTGSHLEPKPDVYLDGMELKEGRDFAVSYRDNVGAKSVESKGYVVITGVGRYWGSKEAIFKILPGGMVLKSLPFWFAAVGVVAVCVVVFAQMQRPHVELPVDNSNDSTVVDEVIGETGSGLVTDSDSSTAEEGTESSASIPNVSNERNKIIDISAGGGHTVALQGNGTVLAVGDDEDGESNVSGWGDAQAVSAGKSYTVSLLDNGTVVATGENEDGQCNVWGWADVQSVSAGEFHTVALLGNGTVVATGNNDYNQCDVSGWRDVRAVSAGRHHTIALLGDGTVVSAGSNEDDRCDVSGWRDVRAVSAGRRHTVGLLKDGTVVATGNNDFGQCEVSGWRDVQAVTAGYFHTVALLGDGTVVATGLNDDGQCNVSGWRNVRAVRAGCFHTVALLVDGSVVATGNNEFGQCNVSGWGK